MTTCESGWTGDRCTFPLGHDGDHSNDLDRCERCGETFGASDARAEVIPGDADESIVIHDACRYVWSDRLA